MLLGAGFVSGWLKSFWSFFYDHTIGWMSNKCKIELVIEEQDHLEAFVWVNMWMEKNLRAKRIAKLRLQKKTERNEQEIEEKAFEFLPSYGFYWMWWKYKLLTFRSEKKEGGGSDYNAKKLIRTITLELWGTRNRNLLMDIVLEARAQFESNKPENMKFYVHSSDYWEAYSMEKRKLDSVYLPEKQLEDILGDFETFFKSKDKYKQLGIPWRRTLLFDGPPGSGKSTLVQALSSYFKVPIYYFNASKVGETGARQLLFDAVSPCIILMEDIDSLDAAKKRTNTGQKDESAGKKKKDDMESLVGLKPSELLNLLDGIIATEQRVVIMTTNHPETLDPAVLRPGRMDRRFHIGFAVDAEIQRFYSRAKEYYKLPEYTEFRRLLPEQCTIADAQGAVFQLNSDLTVS